MSPVTHIPVFEIGSVVRVKGIDSPEMVVEVIEETITCIWFDANYHQSRGDFDSRVLELVPN